MNKNSLYLLLVLLSLVACRNNNTVAHINNPVLPGWFADPTIKKFGDIYYIYATTDNEMLASGAPTVWYSNDLVNWYNYIMEVPSLDVVDLRNFWAPDIIERNGKYYLYFGNCQAGCNIYGYESDTPVGPWKKLYDDDTPVIANGFPRENFPSLDAQFFTDDDGKIYAVWGTWVHYNGGYAVGELDASTMKTMKDGQNIPLEQTPNPFEAPYLMKKGEKYILMYSAESCHDKTYKVLYAYANNPYGPYTPGKNNPILQTNEDGSVNGPGHHSVLQNGDDYYIVYHRHDYPFTRGGLARQVCIDKMIFENDSTIKAVVPTDEGILSFETSPVPENIAYQRSASASSSYLLDIPDYDYTYSPSQAFDDDNATMWKAGDNTFPQSLVVDLGKTKQVRRVCTQFEFASYYYQYTIEYSNDSINWKTYTDKSTNKTPGSPMIDEGNIKARYLRLTILGTEKTGLYAAVWNLKVYEEQFKTPLDIANVPSKQTEGAKSTKTLLVGFDCNGTKEKLNINNLSNVGSLKGKLSKEGDLSFVTDKETGAKAIDFKQGALELKGIAVPRSLEWNGAFTVATWVKNPQIDDFNECLASWCDRSDLYLANTFNAPYYNKSNYGAMAHLDGHFDMSYKQLPKANQWHHIVITFDGVVEKVYVDGRLDNAQIMLLSSSVKNAKIRIGASDIGEYYTGYMASFGLYDYALNSKEVITLYNNSCPEFK